MAARGNDLPRSDTPDSDERLFRVIGEIRWPDRDALPDSPDCVVKAFDVDLRSEQLLGQAVGRDRYEITYSAAQFRRAEKRSADLIVRAYNQEGIQLAESEILFNAPAEARVDLVVASGQDLQPSEFEALMTAVSPVLENVRPGDLTDADLAFLVGETGLDRQWLDFLRRSAALSLDTGLPTVAFYSWARESLPLILADLLGFEPQVLRQGLTSAIEHRIAPTRLREQLDQIMRRLEQLRLDRGLLVTRRVRGRLRRRGSPLAGFTVRGFDLTGSRELGYDVSDGSGLFALTYIAPRETPSERRLRLRVLDSAGKQLHETEIAVKPDREEINEIEIPVEALPDPPSPSVAELATTLNLDIPLALQTALQVRGIHSLADIRSAGGIGQLDDLPEVAAVAQVLNAHANLSAISSDVRANAAVIEKGYTSLARIARATPAAFVSATGEALGDFKAAQFHVTAYGVANLLDGAVMEMKSAKASGYPYQDPDSIAAEPHLGLTGCQCEDCQAAVSPLAYLADLLDYTLSHLENDGASIDLAFVTQKFHQPFGDLPTSCADVDRRVRQVRICVEALRGHLAAINKTLPAAALNDYLLQAYSMLLTKLGTSYEQIRLAKTGGLSARTTLADRLGLDLDLAGPDRLGALLLDPLGQNGQSAPLSELALEQLFGLVDTTRDPLSDGAKFGDPQNQITRWSLSGVEWGRNTDTDGIIYVGISHPQASVAQVDLYRDAPRTDLVASGKGPIAQDIAVTEKENSGLSGTFDVASAALNQGVQIFAIPRWLSWRLQHLRTLWKQQDWPSDLYAEGQAVAELKQLPQGLQFPAALADKIHYAAESQVLLFEGVMSDADRAALLAASSEPAYTKAVGRLYRRSQRLPIVDPDLIGPDDFRLPFPKPSLAEPDRAFDLWVKRRAWIDARLGDLSQLKTAASSKASLEELPEGIQFPDSLLDVIAYEPAYESLIFTGVMTEAQRDLLLTVSPDVTYQEAVEQLFNASQQPPFDVPDLPAMLAQMYEPVTYDGTTVAAWAAETPVGDLDGLAEKLATSVEVEETVERIQADLNLTVDSFTRLLAIRAKDQLAAVDPQAEPVKAEEWAGVLSILTQARKLSVFPAWHLEERATSLRFDPTAFWISLREPNEGAWPPVLPELSEQRPIIDPESVERDELPEPLVGRRALVLWETRQAKLAQTTEELKTIHQEQGFEPMLNWALGEPGVTDPPPLPPAVTLATLLTALASNDPAEVNTAEETIASALHMTAEAFTRLMNIAAKDHPAAADWAEMYAILTTAQKQHRQFPTWVTEEQQANLTAEYWRAIKAALPRWRASVEARVAWQQALRSRGSAPLIDPDLLVTADFRDPFANQPAFHRKQQRADWIKTQLDTLAGAPTSLAGLDEIAVEALIGPEVAPDTLADLTAMREVSGLDSVLTELWGRPLPDLESLLADLTGSSEAVAAEARKTIATSLYLAVDDFVAFVPVWDKVATNLPITDAEWDLVGEILTRSAMSKSVFSLGDERQRGIDISGRLDQLGLEAEALSYLLRARELLAADAPLLDSEREAIRAILVQARKRRAFAEWKQEEREDGLVLGPDEFQIPPPAPMQFPPKLPAPLPEWRASWRARRDWQDSLQSRVDQAQAVVQGFRESVGDGEAGTLPLLRDALILASNAAGTGLEAKASSITDLLLIDAKTGACQMTTRVAQAIETLHILLFGARSRQLNAHPDLALQAPDFDEEWKWLGSYATWRAAMFVYMYPENILLPSLRRRVRQTPAFRTLLDTVRGNRRFDPEAACLAARQYAAYFRDVCNLVVEATCVANIRLGAGDCRSVDSVEEGYRELFYMFARSPATKAVYVSTQDVTDQSGYGQSFWRRIEEFDAAGVTEIIGAAPYERDETDRSLYVFARARDPKKIVFVKYDLEKPDSSLDLNDVTLPDYGPWPVHAVAAQTQKVTDPPAFAIQTAKRVLYRSLDSEGGDWAPASPDADQGSNEWDPFVLFELTGKSFNEIKRALTVRAQLDDTDQNIEDQVAVCFAGDKGGVHVVQVPLPSAPYSSYVEWTFDGEPLGAVNDPSSNFLFSVFASAGGGSVRYHLRAHPSSGTAERIAVPHVAQLSGVASHFGPLEAADGRFHLVHGLFGTKVGFYRLSFSEESSGSWLEEERVRIVPLVQDSAPLAFAITERLSPSELQVKRETIEEWYLANSDLTISPPTNLIYLQEAYDFVPVQIALQLQRNGFFQETLDWLRTVYDYTAKVSEAKIYYGLKDEHDLPLLSPRAVDWLLDPLDLHGIGAARRDTNTRFTLLSIVRCLLEFADAEFTRDTAESVPRARMLYLMALKLLERNELNKNPNECKEVVVALDAAVADEQQKYMLQSSILILNDSALVTKVTQKVLVALSEGGGFEQAWVVVSEAKAAMPPAPRLGAVVQGNHALGERAHAALLSRPTVAAAVGRASYKIGNDYRRAVERFSGLSGMALEQSSLPWLHRVGSNGNAQKTMQAMSGKADTGAISPSSPSPSGKYSPSSYVPAPSYKFCIPPNPILEALRLHAELNLFKIRNCRNIAGMERHLEPYAAPTDTVSGLPMIGADGQLVLPGLRRLAPTPYRYSVLIERSKQLVGLAQQVEAAFLSALEKADDARYSLLRARQDLRLARAGVRLQSLRVQEAQSGMGLAQLQQDRAQIQVGHYQDLLNEGLSDLEGLAIAFMVSATAHHIAASIAAGFQPGGASAVASSAAAAASTIASIVSTYAEFERRRQEWEFQKSLAQQDVLIGAQQVKIAQDHVRVAGQERLIAEMQTEHSEAVVDFLTNKFTNRELYDWMSDVLERVYSFFLQQATAMAQVATNQLAFERQEVPPPFVQADYWEGPSDDSIGVTDSQTPDRRGLTGSARLLRDIYQLDQYAFETDKRKLQLSRTISLAQFPAEFQRFRETGVMVFATPMELFDRDFPGHYLRLIKRVRTSVVALIPPSQGIRATLSTTGTSRVVIGGDVYQTVVVNAGPQLVALTSPRDASGQFELDEQPGMLRPYEGMGVDTTWELRMPRAANLFDYRTIADVLLTIDYTALNSFDYRQEVIQTLKPTFTADRPFSFRHQFADQWYDLHNPDQTATPMAVTFTTTRGDFPPNLQNLKIRHLALYFSRGDGTSFEVPVTSLRFKELGSAGFVGGGAISIDGLISTRKGNAGSWTAMMGKAVAGEWELTLPNAADMKNRFKTGEIEDILFVITWSGRTPEWPA